MKSNNPLTVEQLNEIQDKWMALDSNDPEPKKREVFKLMELLPARYLNVSEDGKMAGVILDGAPMFAERQSLQEALKWLKDYSSSYQLPRTRFDVAWCGKTGRWVTI